MHKTSDGLGRKRQVNKSLARSTALAKEERESRLRAFVIEHLRNAFFCECPNYKTSACRSYTRRSKVLG
jgi:hypothetical protein